MRRPVRNSRSLRNPVTAWGGLCVGVIHTGTSFAGVVVIIRDICNALTGRVINRWEEVCDEKG